MTEPNPVLLTGATGRLGRELTQLLADLGVTPLLTPTRKELDIARVGSVGAYFERTRPRLVVHAAAYTDVRGAEQQRSLCWNVNVVGTRNLASAAHGVGARFLLVSTDYVFWGDPQAADQPVTATSEARVGPGYHEDDPPGPVRNYYALTKLVAEESARSCPGSLILRTSFRPREWPYQQAFDDLYTTQDYVDVIAPLTAEVVYRYDRGEVPYDTLHVATERKSVYELAQRRAPTVTRASRASAGVELPADVSLDTSRWQALRATWT